MINATHRERLDPFAFSEACSLDHGEEPRYEVKTRNCSRKCNKRAPYFRGPLNCTHMVANFSQLA